MKKLLFVTGLTCSGKTKALNEFLRNDTAHPICCDSTQIYKGIPLISNSNIVCNHKHLYHQLSLTQPYSCSDFIKDSTNAIKQISSINKIPLFEGGTLYYAYSLISNQVEIYENYDKYREKAVKLVSQMEVSDKVKEINKLAQKLIKEDGLKRLNFDLNSWDIRIIFSYQSFASLQYLINRRAHRLFTSYDAYNEAIDAMRASKQNPKVKDILGVQELINSLYNTDKQRQFANLYCQRVGKFAKNQLKYFTKAFKPYNAFYTKNLTSDTITVAIESSREDYEKLCKETTQQFQTTMSSEEKCHDTLHFSKVSKEILNSILKDHKDEVKEYYDILNKT